MKSPVNRFGGKYYLRNWITGMIPPGHVLYCEPFCGAGHLLFSKTPSQVEVANDIDCHLIGFFELLKDDTRRLKLVETLESMPYSRSLWQGIRKNWKQGNIPSDEIEHISWWYYLNRTTFAGDQLRGGFAVPSTTGRNPAQSFRNAVDGFNDIARRLRNVTIESLPYAECIRRYDSPRTLFYCDPPYLGTEHYYGRDSFSQDDHHQLAEMLNVVKGKVMISHCQNSLYDELYRGWNRHEYQSFKGSYKSEGEEKPKTTECLWTNFEPRRPRSLF